MPGSTLQNLAGKAAAMQFRKMRRRRDVHSGEGRGDAMR
jgi:hypothetical protein